MRETQRLQQINRFDFQCLLTVRCDWSSVHMSRLGQGGVWVCRCFVVWVSRRLWERHFIDFPIAIIVDEQHTLDKTRSSTHVNNSPVHSAKRERKQHRQSKKVLMKLHSVELDVKPRHVIFCIPPLTWGHSQPSTRSTGASQCPLGSRTTLLNLYQR